MIMVGKLHWPSDESPAPPVPLTSNPCKSHGSTSWGTLLLFNLHLLEAPGLLNLNFLSFYKFLTNSPYFLTYSGTCTHVLYDISSTTFSLALSCSGIYSHLSDLLWLMFHLRT